MTTDGGRWQIGILVGVCHLRHMWGKKESLSLEWEYTVPTFPCIDASTEMDTINGARCRTLNSNICSWHPIVYTHTPRLIDSFAPCAVIKFANYLSVVGLTYQYIYNVRWYFRYLLHMSLWLHVLAQEINHEFDVFCRRVLSNEYAGAVHRNWLQPQIGDTR